MSAQTQSPEQGEQQEGPRKRSRMPLLLGLLGAILFGGGGFAAAYSGLLPLGGGDSQADHGGGTQGAEPGAHGATNDHAAEPVLGDIAFVPVEPVIINVGRGGANRHLKFRSELEVQAGAQAQVGALMPRIVDVINGYLRAVEIDQLEEPAALIRLRAQLLRRIQLVAGESRVRDLLVMEFVLN